MEKIDFNSQDFSGFEQGEDIYIDTCVLLALFSNIDSWHETVKQLFDNYIFPEEVVVLLYISPLVVDEVLHLSKKSLEKFIEKHNRSFTQQQKDEFYGSIKSMLTTLIKEKVLQVLDGDSQSVLNQIELSDSFGSADAAHVSIANLYGANFLTVDNKLVQNIYTNKNYLPNIRKIFYTTSKYRNVHPSSSFSIQQHT